MKKFLQIAFLSFYFSLSINQSNAQQKLIHYWHFNNLVNYTTVAINPSTLPAVKANYSTLDTNKAVVAYKILAGTAGNALTYWDNVSPGDTVNARLAQPAGLGYRPRNPSDSMQLMFYIPTKGYQNISIKFETQKSSASAGAAIDSFDYSIDSGTTWRNFGVSILYASNVTTWTASPGISVNINSDALANNNNKLVFRIRFGGAGTSGTSGNVRFDNITIEGDTLIATPVTLLNFNAKIIDHSKVNLKWQTTSEINNDYFIIEKSFDEQNWVEAGKIKGAENSNSIKTYQTNDEVENGFGVIYYRLKQVDLNGEATTFNPIVVNLNNNNLPTVISVENPVQNNTCIIKMYSENQTLLTVIIRNILGNTVQQTSYVTKGNTSLNLDVASLNNGTYFLEIKDGNSIISSKKIIKQ